MTPLILHRLRRWWCSTPKGPEILKTGGKPAPNRPPAPPDRHRPQVDTDRSQALARVVEAAEAADAAEAAWRDAVAAEDAAWVAVSWGGAVAVERAAEAVSWGPGAENWGPAQEAALDALAEASAAWAAVAARMRREATLRATLEDEETP